MSSELILTVGEVRNLYERGDSAHDFAHVLRVVELAVRLARSEGADIVVVHTAALLHDVPVQDGENSVSAGRKEHHLAAAEFSRQLLASRGLGTDAVANVVHCIEAHRFRDQTIQPETLEAKCLYDADKLDSIGAIGIARAFAYAGAHNNRLWNTPVSQIPEMDDQPDGADYTPVHEYVYKLDLISDTLYTQTARRIGEARHRFMREFFHILDGEVLGER